jgi:hypothetical protein
MYVALVTAVVQLAILVTVKSGWCTGFLGGCCNPGMSVTYHFLGTMNVYPVYMVAFVCLWPCKVLGSV